MDKLYYIDLKEACGNEVETSPRILPPDAISKSSNKITAAANPKTIIYC